MQNWLEGNLESFLFVLCPMVPVATNLESRFSILDSRIKLQASRIRHQAFSIIILIEIDEYPDKYLSLYHAILTFYMP